MELLLVFLRLVAIYHANNVYDSTLLYTHGKVTYSLNMHDVLWGS